LENKGQLIMDNPEIQTTLLGTIQRTKKKPPQKTQKTKKMNNTDPTTS
jgi:hypothetical protein